MIADLTDLVAYRKYGNQKRDKSWQNENPGVNFHFVGETFQSAVHLIPGDWCDNRDEHLTL